MAALLLPGVQVSEEAPSGKSKPAWVGNRSTRVHSSNDVNFYLCYPRQVTLVFESQLSSFVKNVCSVYLTETFCSEHPGPVMP